MIYERIARIILVMLFSFAMILSTLAQVEVYDGFESKALDGIWRTDRMEKGALVIQNKVVRKGQSAAMITLKTGDVFDPGTATSKDNERDEIREATKLESQEGKTYEFKFSLFLPDSFPIVPIRLVIAQWKQRCQDNPLCSDASPVLAIRYVSGKLFVTIQTDSAKKIVFQTTDEIRGQWLDFRFRVRFSRLTDGEVYAWLNDKQIVIYNGITCYSSQSGYPEGSKLYFKTGLYRDVMPEPMVIYIDEYSKKEL